jgi:hypothetical protein
MGERLSLMDETQERRQTGAMLADCDLHGGKLLRDDRMLRYAASKKCGVYNARHLYLHGDGDGRFSSAFGHLLSEGGCAVAPVMIGPIL